MFTNKAQKWLDKSKSTNKIILAGTGHRPDGLKLSYNNEDFDLLTNFLQYKALPNIEFDVAVSGGAMGFDLAFAHAAHKIGKSVILAKPFVNYEQKFNTAYKSLLNSAESFSSSLYICQSGFGSYSDKYFHRNKWMVDVSTKIFGMFNIKDSLSGTSQCVRYAQNLNKSFSNYYEQWMVYLNNSNH